MRTAKEDTTTPELTFEDKAHLVFDAAEKVYADGSYIPGAEPRKILAPQSESDKKTYTFANGTTVEYLPSSAYWQTKIGTQASNIIRPTMPAPPLYKNELRDTMELNVNDPAYQAALQQAQYRWSMQKLGMLISTGLTTRRDTMQAALDATPPLDPAEQAAYAAMLDESGIEDTSDGIDVLMMVPAWNLIGVRYVAIICCKYDAAELLLFCQHLTGQIEMEAAVQSAAENFQGDVPE